MEVSIPINFKKSITIPTEIGNIHITKFKVNIMTNTEFEIIVKILYRLGHSALQIGKILKFPNEELAEIFDVIDEIKNNPS